MNNLFWESLPNYFTIMRLQTFIIFFLSLLIVSCEGVVEGNGKVISKTDQSPIDSVEVNFFGDSIYTDKDGKFSLSEFVGCTPSCPDLELILTKKGYKPKYVNLTKEIQQDSAQKEVVIELTPTSNKMAVAKESNLKRFFYYSSMMIALSSLLTFIYTLTDLRNKAEWIPIILFGTLTVKYNYLENCFHFSVFRPSVFMYVKFAFEPTWYKINYLWV